MGTLSSRPSTIGAPYGNIPRDSNGRITGAPPGAAIKRSTTSVYSVTTGQNAGTGAETVNDDTNAYWNTNSPGYLQGVIRNVIVGAGTGAASEYTLDAHGNVTQKRDWDSTKASGLPSSLNSSNAVIENHAYDGYGNQTSMTDARNTVTTWHYDSNSLYLTSQVVNSNSNLGTRSRTTTYSFDFNTG